LNNSGRLLVQNTPDVTIRGGLDLNGGGGNNWSGFQGPQVRNMQVGGRVNVTDHGTFSLGASVVTTRDLPTCLTPAPTSRLTIFSATGDTRPALDVSGRLALCATTVYLAGPRTFPNGTANNVYSRQSLESGPECNPSLPCPLVSGNGSAGAYPAMTKGDIIWHAPTTPGVTLTPNMPLPTDGGIEDLALWGESALISKIGSGSTLRTRGIYFTPNSAVELRGGNSATEPVDAQFISRTVKMLGGTYTMRPSPANSVPIPAPGSVSLIR
jgi:hypothetical protein